MKKLILTSVLFYAFIISYATIRRINNNPGITPIVGLVYSNFSTAVADAVNGDTLYVEPSTINYTGVNITKRLVIIGNGWNIAANAGLVSPLSYMTTESRINSSFQFNVGSENTVVVGIIFGNSIDCNANNIRFMRCRFEATFNLNASNTILEQSLINATNGSSSISNNLVKNCLITFTVSNHNNTIFDQSYISSLSNSSNNCTFTNCIVKDIQSGLSTTNTFSYSLRIGGTFPVPAINNNIENVVLSNVFIVPSPGGLADKDYRLKSGSPAIGTGTSGQDMGPFGALPSGQPYRLSGQANIPIVTNFNVSSVGSTASGLVGSITIQSNN